LRIFQACKQSQSEFAIRCVAEAQVCLYIPKILKHPDAIIPDFLQDLEQAAQSKIQETQEGDFIWGNKACAALMLSLLCVKLDFNSFLQPYGRTIKEIISNLLKEAQPKALRFSIASAC